MDFPTWLIAVIAVGGSIVLIVTVCCIWRCCCRGHHDKTFRWIERLGIPLAKEGEPAEEDLNAEMRLRVTLNQNRHNYGYDEQQDMNVESRPRQISEPDDPEPFKRLEQLGIPRARIEPSPAGVRKIPHSPLPSPTPDVDSDDDSTSIVSNGS